MAIMPKLIKVTIVAEDKTPKQIKGKAILNGILNINAATEADQAPVKGNGKAVNITKAIAPYFAYFPLKLILVLLKKFVKIRRPVFENLEMMKYIFSNPNKIIIDGIISPKTAKNIALETGNL